MAVCITGMHRSGTSMVAKLLHESGLYLGPDANFNPPGPANADGHWENRRFVRLNRRVFKELGGRWDRPPPVPASWTEDRFRPLRAEAEALLAEFVGREPWGWKDPRNCLTLPFWRTILDPVRVIVVVRNPLEVAASLSKRDGLPRAQGLALWQVYNQRLLDAVAPSDRVVTHYGMYFRDPEFELRRVLSFMGLAADEAIIERASAARKDELRHHRLATEDLFEADVAPAIVALYGDLCREAGWRDSGPAEEGTSGRVTSCSIEEGPRIGSADPSRD